MRFLTLFILGLCLVVIFLILVLPDIDLLDAAGAEVFSASLIKCFFGALLALLVLAFLPALDSLVSRQIEPLVSPFRSRHDLHSSLALLSFLRF
jgi:hypothetical protein